MILQLKSVLTSFSELANHANIVNLSNAAVFSDLRRFQGLFPVGLFQNQSESSPYTRKLKPMLKIHLAEDVVIEVSS